MDTFSTTCRPETYRLLMIIALNKGYIVRQFDVKNAFIHAPIDKEIYLYQPEGYSNKKYPKKVLKLLKALYGLKQSPRLWYEFLAIQLAKLGFIIFPYDNGVFINTITKVILLCHVDDILILGPEKEVEELAIKIANLMKLEPMGEVSTFLGQQININKEKQYFTISLYNYTKTIIKKFNKENIYKYTTPVDLTLKLTKNKNQATKQDIQIYQQEVGSLIWLAIKTRPDIAFAVNQVARFMSNPFIIHFKALDRIWGYLNYNTDYVLIFYYNIPIVRIQGFSDSDWGNYIPERKSTSGYIFF